MVDWSYILKGLELIGFSEKFMTLITRCLSTVSFFILVNGPFLKPERGLRQGNLISLYLFLLVAEKLILIDGES